MFHSIAFRLKCKHRLFLRKNNFNAFLKYRWLQSGQAVLEKHQIFALLLLVDFYAFLK